MLNVKFLKGTVEEYTALTVKDVNTFYYVGDTDLYLGTNKLTSETGLSAALSRIAQNEADIDDLEAQLTELTANGAGSIKQQIDTAIATLRTELEAKIKEAKDLADTNKTAINAINNADTGILAQAKTYTDTKAAKVDAKVTAVNEKIGEVTEGKTVIEMIHDIVDAGGYDDTAVKASIKANTDAIAVLNGGETKAGSVKKQVADAVASIVKGAPEAYDTLVEISDWISTHSESASAMNTAIQANKTDITALKTLLGELPEGDAADTIIEYINNKVAGVDFATADAQTLASAKTYADTKKTEAVNDAKKYADGLAGNYATKEQGDKADTAVQTVAEGTTNGTVAVDGTDVVVHGLKSAAFVETTAFDAAGSATAALTQAKSYVDNALTWGSIE